MGGVGGGWNANEGGFFNLLFCILFAFYCLDLIYFICVYSVDFDWISEQKFRPLKKCPPCERIADFEPFFFKGFNSFFL